jgi:hypothetical protein
MFCGYRYRGVERRMSRLPLDDILWSALDERNGTAGWVPERLSYLLSNPGDVVAFADLWPHLASEGSAYSAGHATLPYILDIAESLPCGQRVEYLAFVGILVVGTDAGVHEELRTGYQASLPRALALVAEELPFDHDAGDTRWLLGAAAALKGYPKVADVIQSLDVLMECPHCGERVEDVEG